MPLTPSQQEGLIKGSGDVLGGLFQLFGRKQELKGIQYQSQSEMLKAMSEQKRLEAQERTKRNLIMGVIFTVIVLAVIITIMAMRKKS